MVDEYKSWQGAIGQDEVRRLTRDRKQMQRRARRALARKRKYRMQRRKIIHERQLRAILMWDHDQDGKLSRLELRQLLTDLIKKAPPTEQDLDTLMRPGGRAHETRVEWRPRGAGAAQNHSFNRERYKKYENGTVRLYVPEYRQRIVYM